jgi:hypothetical protein
MYDEWQPATKLEHLSPAIKKQLGWIAVRSAGYCAAVQFHHQQEVWSTFEGPLKWAFTEFKVLD